MDACKAAGEAEKVLKMFDEKAIAYRAYLLGPSFGAKLSKRTIDRMVEAYRDGLIAGWRLR